MGEDIGYKKPPKNTQWKRGQSGNPKGRPAKESGKVSVVKEEKMFEDLRAVILPRGTRNMLDSMELQRNMLGELSELQLEYLRMFYGYYMRRKGGIA